MIMEFKMEMAMDMFYSLKKHHMGDMRHKGDMHHRGEMHHMNGEHKADEYDIKPLNMKPLNIKPFNKPLDIKPFNMHDDHNEDMDHEEYYGEEYYDHNDDGDDIMNIIRSGIDMIQEGLELAQDVNENPAELMTLAASAGPILSQFLSQFIY